MWTRIGKEKGGYGRPPLDYFLTSPGAGVGLGAPELSFSAGIILWDPADPVVGDGFDFVPPVEPFGLRSTAPLLPPACSSICLVVPWALAAADVPSWPCHRMSDLPSGQINGAGAPCRKYSPDWSGNAICRPCRWRPPGL